MTQQQLPKRVLVVDDNRDAADLLIEMLSMCGFDAMPAYDGMAALRAAESFQPAAILLDLGMPGMDGFDVMAALRRQERFSATFVVALTAWGDPQTRERTTEAGFDIHLVKPAPLAAILAALEGARV